MAAIITAFLHIADKWVWNIVYVYNANVYSATNSNTSNTHFYGINALVDVMTAMLDLQTYYHITIST